MFSSFHIQFQKQWPRFEHSLVFFLKVLCKISLRIIDTDYRMYVETMLQHYHDLGYNMSIKLHFLYFHLWIIFPRTLVMLVRYKEMEHRYRGYWNVTMRADYCWILKQECDVSMKGRQFRDMLFYLNELSSTNHKFHFLN